MEMNISVEMRKKEREQYLDKIRGSLIGGAVGDALGYAVEFMSYQGIIAKYGKGGIQEYDLDFETGLAIISDDTQMTLFTANGILLAETKSRLKGVPVPAQMYINDAYKDWMLTQSAWRKGSPRICWLLDVPDLHARRAPGITCLQAMRAKEQGCVEEPINNSKGCGGVMRVAPVGLYYGPLKNEQEREKIAMLGANAAALTHGHPLGYIPAAILTHLVNVGVYGGCQLGDTMEDAVREAMDVCDKIFESVGFLKLMRDLLEKAMELAVNDRPDIDNIKQLGEGWVGEEALAIAVYCCCRYRNDFTKAMIAAVNHSGDSDSTGAVAGNILGAWLGYRAIEDKWLQKLEMRAIILDMADDLCYGCMMSETGDFKGSVWEGRYVHGRYVKRK